MTQYMQIWSIRIGLARNFTQAHVTLDLKIVRLEIVGTVACWYWDTMNPFKELVKMTSLMKYNLEEDQNHASSI